MAKIAICWRTSPTPEHLFPRTTKLLGILPVPPRKYRANGLAKETRFSDPMLAKHGIGRKATFRTKCWDLSQTHSHYRWVHASTKALNPRLPKQRGQAAGKPLSSEKDGVLLSGIFYNNTSTWAYDPSCATLLHSHDNVSMHLLRTSGAWAVHHGIYIVAFTI